MNCYTYFVAFTIIMISCTKESKEVVTEYHSNGVVKSSFVHNKETDIFKITEFDSLGNKAQEYYKKNNLVHGIYKVYYPSGELGLKVNYKEGLKVGKEEAFYKNGQIFTIFNYKDGVRDEEFFVYYKNGKQREYGVYKAEYYQPNKVIYVEGYDTNGIIQGTHIRPIVENLPDTMELNQLDTISVSIIKKANTNFNYYFAYELEKYNGEAIDTKILDIKSDRSNLKIITSNEDLTYVVGFTEKGTYLFHSACFIGDKSIPIEDWQPSAGYHKIIIVK